MSPPEVNAALAAEVIDVCRDEGWTIGTAESLTGGSLAAALVSIPGASDVVRGGIVAYAKDLKHTLLGVQESLLAEQGTVSAECASAMARGACDVLGVRFALSTTGVAGPDRSEGHAVGTVYLAVHGRGHSEEEVRAHEAFTARGDRSEIRDEATYRGLSLLLTTLRSHGPAAP